MDNEVKIIDMFYRSETKPRIREQLISREQYLEFIEEQLEENRVLCVQGAEGVGVTTTLALFNVTEVNVPRTSTTAGVATC